MQFSKPAVVVACPSRPLSSSVMRPSSSRTRILKPLIVICRSHIAVEVCMLDCESGFMVTSESFRLHQLVWRHQEQLPSSYRTGIQAS